MPHSAEFDDFERDLEAIESLINLIAALRSFGGATPGESVCSDSFDLSARELHKLSGNVRTHLPVAVGSLILYACGRFEFFVVQLVKMAADREMDKAESYADLPKPIRESLRQRLLIVLSESSRYSHLKLADSQLVLALSNVINAPDEAPTEVPTAVLASTDANMRPRILSEVFTRVGIKDIWGEVCKQAPLRTHFQAQSESACKTAATNFLDELMTLRNSLAHPTGSHNFPSPEQALEYCESLRFLARAISDVANLPR